MKDFVKRAKSFITFDFPLQVDYINIQFTSTHSRYQADFPGWSTNATRQKMIAIYWLNHVLRHFAFLVGVPALLVLLMRSDFDFSYLSVVFLAGLISFPILLLFHYWPNYSYDFLPKLETVKESYECKQIEQLEKCRQAQLSNFALSLVFYVFDKTSSINTLQCNDQSAVLLMKLYGVDKGSIKKNLELILGKKHRLLPRKYTEIHKRFDEAYTFFEELHFKDGMRLLRELEAKFQT